MGDKHLDTIPATESDEFIKSCVENLFPNPSESEGENGCDVLVGFTTFSNVLFDDDYDSNSSDDQSPSVEDVSEKIYSNPLFDEEIIPMKIDQHSLNAESDLIESLPNHDSSITISSKTDSLFEKFAGELTLLKSFPSGIDKTDYISSPFEELSDIGSPRADDHEHLELLEMLKDPYVEVALQAPLSLDYIPGPEEPEQAPPSPDYVPGVVVASTTADQAPSAEETEPFETDESAATPPPHPAYRMTARISIPAPVPMPAWSDSEIVRLLAMSSPSASPLSPWSSPPPQIPFPPLPPILSPPLPVLSPAPSPSPIHSLGYRAAMIQL
nr:hypothetical protein [Tanacetum cinerariifolium]